MPPLSQDLRKRLVRAVEEGASAREAAARFAVSASAAIKLVRRVRETGSTAPAQIGGYRKPLLAGQEEFLRELTAMSGWRFYHRKNSARARLGRKPGRALTMLLDTRLLRWSLTRPENEGLMLHQHTYDQSPTRHPDHPAPSLEKALERAAPGQILAGALGAAPC
ncbi:hypothetical protein [Roseomonas sp. BN140053]|uniref:hypothetical protein n=1 Tax=Roseomonas sp. BN140053 TaxID=3391898 RepID=UPI0039EBDD32